MLGNTEYILQIINTDEEKEWLYLEKYDTNLNKLLLEQKEMSLELKMEIIKQALSGIIEMHEKGIIHGCVTGRNIFIKDIVEDKIEVAIGNFRLSGTIEDAKCEMCNPYFRSEPVVNDFSHDMYSFGIVMLELLGNIKLTDRLDTDDKKHSIIKAVIHDEKMRICIVNLLSKDPAIRFTAQQLYIFLFD